MPLPAELIQRKRDGEELGADELTELVLSYTEGTVPDYQMAAFLMAVYFRGLDARRDVRAHATRCSTAARRSTSARRSAATVVDKHSTGGVGDKTSLAVAPIVAACGVPVAEDERGGLGHTGGTLDKLESIPGYEVELPLDRFVAQVEGRRSRDRRADRRPRPGR